MPCEDLTPPPMTPDEMTKHLMFHVKHAALDDLEIFRQRLITKNEVMNLVGPATLPHYWSRHVLDSAQLLNHAPEASTWADLGAGAGFPGIVLAILLKHGINSDSKPSTDKGTHGSVYLIDSLAKRCRFLTDIVEELQLPAIVINDRVENIDLAVNAVTARAFAPFVKLFGFAERFFKNGAEGWFLKGESVDNELSEASKTWRFEAQLLTSLSDPRGRLAHIRRLRRAR